MISKVSQALFTMAVAGLATVASSPSTQAGNLPARFGISDFPRELNCWQPFGATVTNICSATKVWSLPLINVGAGWFWVTMTAEGASSSNNVECRTVGATATGSLVHIGGSVALSQFGSAQNLSLATFVPTGGSGMVDCWVNPGGKLHTLSW
jgi:hypothetical protein